MEVHSAIYDSKILNLWTTKPCFEIIHGFLVSVFDKVSKPKLFRFTAQHSSCNLQNSIFRKAKIVQKQKEQVIYFLRATSRRQHGLFVCQITLKAYIECLKSQSKNILKILNWHRRKNSRKRRGVVLHCQTARGSLFNKSYPTVVVAAIVFGWISW